MSTKNIEQIFNFKSQVVLVTGGAKGIGFAICKRFAEQGANIVLSDIDEAVGKEKARNLGGNCRFFKADVSQGKEVVDLVDFTLQEFGKIDVLVNNAGI
ncbi:SDR family NAD(P)-dependent oxidoreductase, partial [Candidatus Gribaldobacteria bacterium]|nr:SDR family NAD(P)-dependent oxidoreductase [Candidatus Gribaldobacteria bacterium]